MQGPIIIGVDFQKINKNGGQAFVLASPTTNLLEVA
jgi:hypothetical protein